MNTFSQNKNSNFFDSLFKGSGKGSLESSVRANFVQKVFGIVFVQLLFTSIMTYFAMTNKTFALFQATHPGYTLLAGVGTIVIMLSFICFSNYWR